ncbi:MAG: hypothetical protein ACYTFA_00115 [Planctomycetota bacterium]
MKRRKVETSKRRNVGTSMGVVALHCVIVLAFCVSAAGADAPADRFVASLEADAAIPAEVRELIRSTWARCKDCDGEEFLAQGLAVLSEQFRGGLDAYDADEYQRCSKIMRGLCSDTNAFVAVNAAAYEIKALAALERLIEAGQRIAELTADSSPHGGPSTDGRGRVGRYSYFTAEIDFLRGYCLLGDLKYEAATGALQRFLETHPDASQRLTIAAGQMLNELANRVPEGIGEVVDLMNYSHRRLRVASTDDIMQQRQQRIVELLDQLVEAAESMEQSGGSGAGGGGSSGKRSPSNPMSESRLPGGAGQREALRDSRRASPGEMWGSMPPAQREQVLQALRDSFPSRYRQLVEQYYEELAKKP